MDVLSPAYPGKHQYRQMAAKVLTEGFQALQHFACAILRPAGEQRVEHGQSQGFQYGDDSFRLRSRQPSLPDGIKDIQAHAHGNGSAWPSV